jgi:hypothetical protein
VSTGVCVADGVGLSVALSCGVAVAVTVSKGVGVAVSDGVGVSDGVTEAVPLPAGWSGVAESVAVAAAVAVGDASLAVGVGVEGAGVAVANAVVLDGVGVLDSRPTAGSLPTTVGVSMPPAIDAVLDATGTTVSVDGRVASSANTVCPADDKFRLGPTATARLSSCVSA